MNDTSLADARPSMREHFFNRARVVAERSSCLRRRIGAIVVTNDEVEICSGYVGAPRKSDDCLKINKCMRTELQIPSGERYELCRSVHAEQNAIINAARLGVSIKDAEIFIWSQRVLARYDERKKDSGKTYGPCFICKKEIINAGIRRVHMREDGVGERTFSIQDLRAQLADEEKAASDKYIAARLSEQK